MCHFLNFDLVWFSTFLSRWCGETLRSPLRLLYDFWSVKLHTVGNTAVWKKKSYLMHDFEYYNWITADQLFIEEKAADTRLPQSSVLAVWEYENRINKSCTKPNYCTLFLSRVRLILAFSMRRPSFYENRQTFNWRKVIEYFQYPGHKFDVPVRKYSKK